VTSGDKSVTLIERSKRTISYILHINNLTRDIYLSTGCGAVIYFFETSIKKRLSFLTDV
jgi:hypothetical protein